MTFPVYLHFGSLRVHPHWFFETLAYVLAFRFYLLLRRRSGDALADVDRWWVIAAAAMGAAVGSKVLYWFEAPRLTLQHLSDPAFLLGAEDHTAGGATALPWGVNFGDGVTRHPTQLYEIMFVLLLAGAIVWASRRDLRPGDRFKIFMVGYFAFRLSVDFLKPDVRVFAGLSAIQCACAAMLLYYARDVMRWAGLARQIPTSETVTIEADPSAPAA